jgi:Mce-associated membrane protein
VTDGTRDTETAAEAADFDAATQADDSITEASDDDIAEAGESGEGTAAAEEDEEAKEDEDEEAEETEETEEDAAAAEEIGEGAAAEETDETDEGTAAAEETDEAEDADEADDTGEADEDADEIDEDADEADELSEESDEDIAEAAAPAERRRRDLWGWTRYLKTVPVILVLLLVITGGAAIWLFYNEYRPDRQSDPQASRAVISAASAGTVAMLSYAPDTLDQDFASAKSHLGGDFLSYYDNFTQQIIAPAAKQKSLKTTARVVTAAVSELHGDSAVVLLFVNQTTTSMENPKPAIATSSVLVTMTRVDGKWLITKFNPF